MAHADTTETAEAIAYDTDAIRALADRQPGLKATVAAALAAATTQAEKMTVAQMRAAIEQHAPIRPGTLTQRDDVAAKYAETMAAHTPDGEELNRLVERAAADRYMIKKLNDRIAAADELAAQFAADIAKDTANAMYALEWKADAVKTALEAAKYAHRIAKAVGNGHTDLPVVVKQIAKDALHTMVTFPAYVLNNGLSGNLKGRELFAAAGAAEFLRDMVDSYGFLGIGGDAAVAFSLYDVRP